jgi:hypothetical protein
MSNFLKIISGVMSKRDFGKKLLLIFLMICALVSFGASIMIERHKNISAAESLQKSEQIKVLLDKVNLSRQAVDSAQSPGSEYFNRLNRALKNLEKTVGADKIDPILERLLLEKPTSDQHVRARVFVLRDSMRTLAATEKGIIGLSSGLEAVQLISHPTKKSLLDVNRIRTDSPFRKTTVAMSSISTSLQAWENNIGDLEAVKELESALLLAADQKLLLDAMEKDGKFNPAQESIYKALKKTAVWMKSAEYADALSKFTSARSKVLDLTKDKDAFESIAKSLESNASDSDAELFLDMTRILTIISIVGALIVVVVGDRRRLYGGIDVSEGADFSRASYLRETQDILPYTQIAVNQASDLGGKVLKALKRFHGVLTEASLSGQRDRLESVQPLNLVESELTRMRHEIVALREQTIQMSLSNSGMSSGGNIADQCIRISAIVDNLELNLNEMDMSIKQAFAYKQGMEKNDLHKISRESEGLILALTQWERQIDRMDGVLEEMSEALENAIHGNDLVDDQRVVPSFKLDA